ncbi:hypothetical protein K492DRAFT_182619 [Lichtheimia hyalospora FSU 10163]|nr:hypothetical protein K492DRAFT_182619 [Lichtheimia hyalospora FSU 10163]
MIGEEEAVWVDNVEARVIKEWVRLRCVNFVINALYNVGDDDRVIQGLVMSSAFCSNRCSCIQKIRNTMLNLDPGFLDWLPNDGLVMVKSDCEGHKVGLCHGVSVVNGYRKLSGKKYDDPGECVTLYNLGQNRRIGSPMVDLLHTSMLLV